MAAPDALVAPPAFRYTDAFGGTPWTSSDASAAANAAASSAVVPPAQVNGRPSSSSIPPGVYARTQIAISSPIRWLVAVSSFIDRAASTPAACAAASAAFCASSLRCGTRALFHTAAISASSIRMTNIEA